MFNPPVPTFTVFAVKVVADKVENLDVPDAVILLIDNPDTLIVWEEVDPPV